MGVGFCLVLLLHAVADVTISEENLQKIVHVIRNNQEVADTLLQIVDGDATAPRGTALQRKLLESISGSELEQEQSSGATTLLVVAALLFVNMVLIPKYVATWDGKLKEISPERGGRTAPAQFTVTSRWGGGVGAPEKAYVRIPYRRFVTIGAWMPLMGMFLCCGWSWYFNFATTTETHCTREGTVNVLPSISASIGQHQPQVFIWRIAISLMITQRVLDGIAYDGFYRSSARALAHRTGRAVPMEWLERWLRAHWYSHMLEQAGLLLLTAASSTENFLLHELGFSTFILAQSVNMLAGIKLFGETSGVKHKDFKAPPDAVWSFRTKKRFAACNACCLVGALACYFVHNSGACYSYLYSGFAFFEYLFVTTNILYHLTVMFDFGDLAYYMALDIPSSRAGSY